MNGRRSRPILSRFPDAGAPKLEIGWGKVNSSPSRPCADAAPRLGPRVPLTLVERKHYLSKLVSRRRNPMHRAILDEADVQAPQPQARQQARVPGPHEDPRRSRCTEPPPEEGSVTARRDDREQVALPGQGPGERLPRGARIRRTRDIRALLDGGKRKRTQMLDVFLSASPVPFSRLGLIVPKHGRTIVERNLLKRRLREIGRRRVLPSLAVRGLSLDVLVRARAGAYRGDFAALAQELGEAVEELCSRGS